MVALEGLKKGQQSRLSIVEVICYATIRDSYLPGHPYYKQWTLSRAHEPQCTILSNAGQKEQKLKWNVIASQAWSINIAEAAKPKRGPDEGKYRPVSEESAGPVKGEDPLPVHLLLAGNKNWGEDYLVPIY